MDLSGKRVLIVGMQASGISASYLARRDGAEVFCYDDDVKKRITDFPFLDPQEIHIFLDSADLVIVSPSIPKDHVVVTLCKERKIDLIGEMEFGSSHLTCPIIAVTGTNGKTTCVTMIEKLLLLAGFKVKAMGNIGYPVSQVILDGSVLDYAVVEVSSFQLEHIKTFHPHIAAVLNVAPDHLDRYDGYAEYVATKKKIGVNQDNNDFFFFNGDDGTARSFVKNTMAKCIPVSTRTRFSDVIVKDNFFMLDDAGICHVKECRVRGEHNKFNLLVAMNIGYICGVKKENMARLAKEYTLLPNRIEYVTSIGGKSYYNDSKGTNIHACIYAIQSIEGTIGLIMGGSDKKEDFCDFFENVDERVKYVAITGANAEKIYNSAMKMGYVNAIILPDLKSCVDYLAGKEVNNVLLSPCSASFDRYTGYAERGEKFKEAVYAVRV